MTLNRLTLFLCAAALAWFGATPSTRQALPTVRLTAADFEYVGAFRLPGSAGGPGGPTGDAYSFNGGGEALAMSADGQGLLLAGSRCCADPADAGPSTAAEITIPEARRVATISGLATAAYRQVHADVMGGRQRDIGCGGPIGGLLQFGGRTIVTAYCYYDAGYVQTRSHFVRSSLSLTGGTVTGPFEVQSPASGGGRAGFVSGYMTTIPTEWQAAFGGNGLTGNCCVPIITRTSWGPAASVIKIEDIGRVQPVPAVSVVGYPTGTPLDGDAECAATSVLFNCNTSVASVVFVPGTASVLFFGKQGTGEACYGFGTSDPALHLRPVDPAVGNPAVDHYCYDPAGGSKGGHAYPYRHQVWAYDANDLLRVKNGQLRPHEVRPYTVWSFDTPFQVIGRDVNGAAYDPTTRLLYVSLGEQDAPRPLVHVWRRVGAGTPPPPPPPPSDTTAPSVSITAPTQGQVVSGASVTFSATGTDNVGITQLESLLDGVVVQTTPAPVFPLSFPFDSRLIPDGAHVVQLRARDAAGNVGMSQAVSFTVTNAAPPPPPPPPPPPVLPTLTATMRTDTCSLRVAVDRTPDGTTGWGIQFRRGSVNHGTRDTTAPYEREAKDIARGSYAITGVWTKTGQAAVTLSYGTLTCE